ncbi:MAG: hypothetical protein IPO60_03005 [Flavobacteriales bacterium]|nr:hypothetical protein [Flavobacteriales bacterium]
MQLHGLESVNVLKEPLNFSKGSSAYTSFLEYPAMLVPLLLAPEVILKLSHATS